MVPAFKEGRYFLVSAHFACLPQQRCTRYVAHLTVWNSPERMGRCNLPKPYTYSVMTLRGFVLRGNLDNAKCASP